LTGSAISPLLPAWVCEPSVLGSGSAIPHLLRYLRPTTGLRGQQTSATSRHRLPLTPPHVVLAEKAMAPFAALSRFYDCRFCRTRMSAAVRDGSRLPVQPSHLASRRRLAFSPESFLGETAPTCLDQNGGIGGTIQAERAGEQHRVTADGDVGADLEVGPATDVLPVRIPCLSRGGRTRPQPARAVLGARATLLAVTSAVAWLAPLNRSQPRP
jgi:hypothetical protein